MGISAAFRTRACVTVAAAAVLAVAGCVTAGPALASDTPAAAVAPGVRPPDFWLTSTQAVTIAARQPTIQRLAQQPGLRARALVAGLGLWAISFERDGKPLAVVRVEDRTRDVLSSRQSDWPTVGSKLNPYKVRFEVLLVILGVAFLALFIDWRRPLRLHNLDLLMLLSFGVSLLLFDRLHPTWSVPLVYPPLGYLFARLLMAGRRNRAPGPEPAAWASTRMLLVALVALEATRVGFSFAYPATTDVSYASVFGANSIHHGLALYTANHAIHLDTYGPLNYLAYLPFELAFPMNANWAHDYLPAAHAASLTFELLTVLGLVVLGRRMREGLRGRRLGLVLACGWVAYPFTLFPLALNSNDGLIVMLLVWSLVALSSPLLRGALLGMAAAAKFTPLALAGLLAAGRGGDRRREIPMFAVAATGIIAISVWGYLPHPGGIKLFWDDTLGYQLGRHSFMSLWGQHPGLSFLRTAVLVVTVTVTAATVLVPRRRETAQVAALAGAILVGLEICLRYWSFFYVAWLVPFVLAGLMATGQYESAPARAPARSRPWSRRARADATPGWLGVPDTAGAVPSGGRRAG
jgi:hypothetical protein